MLKFSWQSREHDKYVIEGGYGGHFLTMDFLHIHVSEIILYLTQYHPPLSAPEEDGNISGAAGVTWGNAGQPGETWGNLG